MPKPGIVVSVRLSPTDTMSVVDIIDKLGVPKTNLSFNQAAKIAIASTFEAFRQNGAIPTRTGFEYNALIDPFVRESYGSRGNKLKVAANLSTECASTHVEPIVPESYEHRKGRIRFEELKFKIINDFVNTSQEEQDEYVALQDKYA